MRVIARPGGRRPRLRLDLASIAVAPAGILLIVAAQAVEGLPIGALLQWQAALVVIGGTLSAVMVSYSPRELGEAVRAALRSFRRVDDDVDAMGAMLVALSIRAHRRGLMALESELDNLSDPFLREGLALAVDDTPADTLRELLSVESGARELEDAAPARVFEAAAGYAPTLGILGAVLGLVDVMRNLSAPGALGSGVASAFVATIYGVGIANLVLLPLAGRLRERAALAARRRELITHGLCAIHLRMNPRLVAQKLRSFCTRMPRIEEIAAPRGMPEPRSRIPA